VGLWAGFIPGLIALVLAAGFQAQHHISKSEVKEPLDHSENMTAVTRRAFVVYKAIAVHRVVNDAGETIARRLNLFWENAGVTPTSNMVSQFGFHAFTGAMPDDFNFPDSTEFTRMTIGPKQTIEMGDMDIPIEIVRMAKTGKARLYVWGWADYNDIFYNTPRHRTEICAEAVVNDPDAQDGAMTFIPCKRHNGVDNETMKKPRAYVP
jgi:hypothetical protein